MVLCHLLFGTVDDFVAFRMEFLVIALTGQQGGRRQELRWAVIGLYNKIFFFISVFLCMHGYTCSFSNSLHLHGLLIPLY